MKKAEAALEKAGIEFEKNHNLAKIACFKIGGRVRLFIRAKSENEISEAVRILRRHKIKARMFGCFTNVLIREGGIKEAYIVAAGGLCGVKKLSEGRIWAGSGAKFSAVLRLAAQEGLSGLEFMAGIPGSVGGAVYMNAGAYGCSSGNLVESVSFVDKNGTIKKMDNKKGVFGYRKSVFQENGAFITGAVYKMKKGKKTDIVKKMKEIIKVRHAKHPWNAACAGSFFKNPPGKPAGRIIEEAGLKGLRQGGAAVSEKHANFIINAGGAKYADVIKLAAKVKKEVYKKTGIKLDEEVRYIR